MCELQELEVRVEKVWEETKFLYVEQLEISLLQRELEQAERWLSSYESTLMAEDYGVGLHHTGGPEGQGQEFGADHQHSQQEEQQQ